MNKLPNCTVSKSYSSRLIQIAEGDLMRSRLDAPGTKQKGLAPLLSTADNAVADLPEICVPPLVESVGTTNANAVGVDRSCDDAIAMNVFSIMHPVNVYIAGPLFNDRERDFNNKVAVALASRGLTYALPQTFDKRAPYSTGTPEWRQWLFQMCHQQIAFADVVLANLDGLLVDDGTAFEMGCAYSSGIPIVGLKTDFRKVGDEGEVNLMLGESISRLARSIAEAVQAAIDIVDRKR